MYGYVIPPKNVTPAELGLFNAFYCGLCLTTGKLMGQKARFTVNYDMTFLNVLLHDLTSQDVKFELRACVAQPIKKKSVVADNPLSVKVAAANILLSYYKALDGVIDGEGLKYKLAKKSLEKAYEIAKKILPQADEIISGGYEKLRKFEDAATVGLDKVSDAFATIMKDVAQLLLGEKASENALRLIYNVGKFVYIADALDDVDEDYKAKRYNPFLALFHYETRAKFISENEEFLKFAFNSTINRIIECFNSLTFTQSYDLLKRVVYYGLREKTKELFSSKKKLAKPRVKAAKIKKSAVRTDLKEKK